MKSRIILKSILSSVIVAFPILVWAASGDSGSGITATGSTAVTNNQSNMLLLTGITVEDDMHIQMDFTQNIVVESLRIRIAKQSDGTNIKIDSLTGVLDKPMSVYVTLVDTLEAGESYTMTVISALSDKGITITDGTDALSEFSAPTPLKQSLIVFNASPDASNTTSPETTETPPTVTNSEEADTESETTVGANTTEEVPPTPANAELPLTGMNPTLFIIFSGLLALFLLLIKRKA